MTETVINQQELYDLSNGVSLGPLDPARDASDYLDAVRYNEEILSKRFPWVANMRTIEDAENFINRTLEQRAKFYERIPGTELVNGIFLDGFAGAMRLKIMDQPDTVEAGYWVDSRKGDRGLATAGLGQMCQIAFNMGMKRIILETDIDNPASQRVAEKNGFRPDGEYTNKEGIKKMKFILERPIEAATA